MMNKFQILLITNLMERLALMSARLDRFFSRSKSRNLPGEKTYGHNGVIYKKDLSWGELETNNAYAVNDCHEMVVDSVGRLFLLTDHPENNILIFDAQGKIIDSWSLGFSSAHGLTLHKTGDVEYLYICDYKSSQVIKTTLSGEVILVLPTPNELGIYKNPDNYLPTQTAIASNGDIYVADGYGSSFIVQFDKDGNYIRHFGGRGKLDSNINCAHGIAIDTRGVEETLLVSSREDSCFKRFSLSGKYLEQIDIPGAYPCRPVIHKKYLYAGVCWSKKLYQPNSGFVTILDEDNKVVSNIGGTEPIYLNGQLKPLQQEDKLFNHCHDVCLDAEDNLYVCEWNAGHKMPVKFKPFN